MSKRTTTLTTISVTPEAKEQLIGNFPKNRKTQDQGLKQFLDEVDELRKQNEFLLDENQKLREQLNGGDGL